MSFTDWSQESYSRARSRVPSNIVRGSMRHACWSSSALCFFFFHFQLVDISIWSGSDGWSTDRSGFLMPIDAFNHIASRRKDYGDDNVTNEDQSVCFFGCPFSTKIFKINLVQSFSYMYMYFIYLNNHLGTVIFSTLQMTRDVTSPMGKSTTSCLVSTIWIEVCVLEDGYIFLFSNEISQKWRVIK